VQAAWRYGFAMPYDRDSRGRVAPLGREMSIGIVCAPLETKIDRLDMAIDRASAPLETTIPRASTNARRRSKATMTLRFGVCALLLGCGPTVKPTSLPPEPEPISRTPRTGKVDPSGRRVVVGEMCPQGAGGRPAVAPLVMRGVGWTDTAAEVSGTVERGSVPRFSVFGVDGKIAGTFESLGIVEVGIAQSVATGTYVGAMPCTYGVTPGATGTKSMDTRAEDPKCGPATKGCGIAVGEVTSPDEPDRKPSYATGGACVSGTELAVDIDGDGKIESFPIAGALDGIRAPAAEWTASATATATCTPTFHVYDMKLAPPPPSGKPPGRGVVVVDKGGVTIDLLGVIDLDADGRRELIMAMKFPTVRTIVVYTATSSSQRLELAGEASSFK
jgi:hypothetical protein